MVRYLALSAFLNLLLFSFISYLLYNTNKPLEKRLERVLTPLVVNLEIKQPQVVKASLELKPEVKTSTAAESSKTELKKQPEKVEKKVSLLKEVFPEVKGYLERYKKVFSTASVRIKNGGKTELNFKRKVTYIPPIKPIKVEYPPSPAVVKIVVLPDGRVVSAVFIKRTGIAKLDRAILEFLKNVRFAPINKMQIQEIKVQIEFTF